MNIEKTYQGTFGENFIFWFTTILDIYFVEFRIFECVAHTVVIDDNKILFMSKEMYEAKTVPSMMIKEVARLSMKSI